MDIQSKNIILQVCKEYGISYEDIMDKNRRVEVVDARNEAMLRMNLKLKMSSLAIGRIFKKTHATVLHAWKKAEKRRSSSISTNDFILSLISEKNKITKRLSVIEELIKTYS